MKKYALLFCLMLNLSYGVIAQNYCSYVPITGSIQINGPQQRVSCSVYDSILQTTVNYQTPWFNEAIILESMNYGVCSFKTMTTPLETKDLGLITYDIGVHSFKTIYVHPAIVYSYSAKIINGNTWTVGCIEEPTSGISYYTFLYFKYNYGLHKWMRSYDLYLNDNFSQLQYITTPTNSDIIGEASSDLYYIYDPVKDSSLNIVFAGPYFNSTFPYYSNLTNDYMHGYDNSVYEFQAFVYNPQLHSFSKKYFPDYSTITNSDGLFCFRNSLIPDVSYFAEFDRYYNDFVTDSVTNSQISSIQINGNLATFINTPIGGSISYVECKVYDITIHSWVSDSTLINGTATGLTIQNNSIQWSDDNGQYSRSYTPGSGWSSVVAQPFMYFDLIDFTPEDFAGIHVRNYSIGTSSVYFDFGDGTTSLDNRMSMWHVYQNSGTYNVCIIDSATGISYCQPFTINLCAVIGDLLVSSDTICEGSSVTLSLSGSVGNVQWQHKDGNIWIDETGTGSDSTVYVFYPSITQVYRAKVTNGSCVVEYSDPVTVKVYNYIPNYLLSDTIVPICANKYHKFQLLNIGNDFTFKWQVLSSGNWINNYSTSNSNTVGCLNNDTTDFRVIIRSGTCFSDTSDLFTLIPDPVAAQPTALADTTCGAGVVHLTASSPGLICWYTNTSVLQILGYGPQYNPYISIDNTYKVIATTRSADSLGLKNNTSGTTDTTSANHKGIQFYCEFPTTIESFMFYPEAVGTYSFHLCNSRSLNSYSVIYLNVTNAGVPVRVYLNNWLNGNSYYNLTIESIPGLPYRYSQTGFNYPMYTTDSSVILLGYVDSTLHTSGDFCSIYDITFSGGCASAPVTTHGTVLAALSAYITPTAPPSICQGQSTNLTAHPTNAVSYQWYRNGILSSQTSTVLNVTQPGNYKVVVHTVSCVDTSTNTRVNMPCIFIPNEQEKITSDPTIGNIHSMYDPGSNQFIIQFNNELIDNWRISIIDLNGKVVMQSQYSYPGDQNELFLSGETLSSGIYAVTVTNGSKSYTDKVVKY